MIKHVNRQNVNTADVGETKATPFLLVPLRVFMGTDLLKIVPLWL